MWGSTITGADIANLTCRLRVTTGGGNTASIDHLSMQLHTSGITYGSASATLYVEGVAQAPSVTVSEPDVTGTNQTQLGFWLVETTANDQTLQMKGKKTLNLGTVKISTNSALAAIRIN
jgi:hypothetical protein